MAQRRAGDALTQARSRLIIDRPFLGSLVLQLPLEAAGSWCKTTATDGRALYFRPAYIERLSGTEVQSVLCREALHCALGHIYRRGRRTRRRWQAACDYAVHAILVAEDMPLPEGSLYEPKFAELSAEEIYAFLDEMEDEREEERTAGDGPLDDQPRELPQSEQERLSGLWRNRLERAALAARAAGHLPAHLERALAPHRVHRLPWRQLLTRHAWACAGDDYSYQRPSSRREGPALFPSLRGHEIYLVAAIDASGSISDRDLSGFLGELEAIKSALRARVSVLVCDQTLHNESPHLYEPWEPLQTPELLPGGGGTSFTPVFEWAERQDRRPDMLVYFTDACGTFPKAAPTYPVLWLVRGASEVPWGERIQLN